MSKMLILNFSAFNSTAKNKSYYKFSAYDIEQRTLYDFFTNSSTAVLRVAKFLRMLNAVGFPEDCRGGIQFPSVSG